MTLFIALVWVFAVSAIGLGAVTLITLSLAVRHQHRLRNGIYTRILAENPSSHVTRMLTVSDSIIEPSLQGQLRERLIEKSTSVDRNTSIERNTSVEERPVYRSQRDRPAGS